VQKNYCVVVGIDDEIKGHLLKAYVVLRNAFMQNNKDELVFKIQSYVKENLAIYKIPHSIEFVNELPRNSFGKVQRFKLKR
jgi:acetyl-CoA synthetase